MITPGKDPSFACRSLRPVAILTLLILGLLAATAAAQPSGGLAAGVFEIDGNLLSEDPNRVDWFSGAFGPNAGVIDPDSCKGRFQHLPNFLDAAFYRDDHWASNAIDLTTFASGNKNNDCIAAAEDPWNLGPGSGPAKSDITEAYSASYVDPATGDNWLLLAFATRTTNGDSEMDFEFNAEGLAVSQDGTVLSGLGPDCGRTIGDFIVSINFVGGGSLPQPAILTWDGTTYIPLDITPPPGEQPRFMVAVNGAPVSAPCGAVAPDGTLSNQYITRQFAEIAINLTKAGVDLVDYCGKPQSTLGFKTRSSAGFTSALKDVKLFKFHLVPSTEATISGPTALCAHETTTLVGPDPALAASPMTFQWSTGETTRSITLAADDMGVGAHSVWLVVQNEFGCKDSTAVVVNVNPEPQVTVAPVSVCAGESGTLVASVSSGTAPFTYSWSNGATTSSITVAQSGEYSVTVTDAAGCQTQGSGTFLVHAPLLVAVADQAVCAGETGNLVAAVTSGGTAPFTYAWSNGATTSSIAPTQSGEYCVTVTDANGCTGQACGTFTVRPALQVSVADVAVCSGMEGTLQAGVVNGTAPLSYSWSTGATTESITVDTDGEYQVTVTDANGCTGQATARLTVRAPVVVTLGDVEICDGETATLAPQISGATAPMTCSWSTGASTPSIQVTGAGEYTVVVRDVNGCEGQATATVTVHPQVDVTVADESVCFGETGTLRARVQVGTGPFQYSWSNGETGDRIHVTTPGEYCVTVTDAHGCTGQACATFQVRTALDVSVADVAVCNGAQGTLQANVDNGVAPFTYSWNTGATTESITVGADGEYTVTVTDANGCSGQATARLTVRAPVAVKLENIEICDGETATIGPRIFGATEPMSCAWSTGANTPTIEVTQAGVYSVTVVDANGCEGTASATVTVHPQVLATMADQSICSGETATLRAQVQTGTGPYLYSWSTGATGDRLQVTQAGTYWVEITDANGCIGQAEAMVTVFPTPTASVRDAAVCEGRAGTLGVTATGGTEPYTYSWNTGETSRFITHTGLGEYCVTVTDANGCETRTCGSILDAGMPVCDIEGPSFACIDSTAVFSVRIPDSVPVASAGMPTHPQSPEIVVGTALLTGQMFEAAQARITPSGAGKASLDLPSPTALQIEWSVSPPEYAQIVSGANEPNVTIQFNHLGRFVISLKLTTSAGCSSECSTEVFAVDCDAPGCPRTVGFWGRQCVQSGGGDTKFTLSQMYRIVGCVDDRSDALNLGSDRVGLGNFCSLINTDDMDQRHQAKRQFAGLVANVCVGNLGIVASNGEIIRLNERTRIDFPPFAAETIGALIDEMDALLIELEPLNLDAPGVKSRYADITRAADALNNGKGILVDCTTGEPDPDTDRGSDPIPGLQSFKPTPNPTTGRTSILYTLTGAAEQSVEIAVYDIAGRRVRILEQGMRKPGSATTVWDGRDEHGMQVARGVYYVRGLLGTERVTSRIVVLRQ